MKLGIVGLPNVGKSTLFNAITSAKHAQAANYPFCTIEPNTGVVAVRKIGRKEDCCLDGGGDLRQWLVKAVFACCVEGQACTKGACSATARSILPSEPASPRITRHFSGRK